MQKYRKLYNQFILFYNQFILFYNQPSFMSEENPDPWNKQQEKPSNIQQAENIVWEIFINIKLNGIEGSLLNQAKKDEINKLIENVKESVVKTLTNSTPTLENREIATKDLLKRAIERINEKIKDIVNKLALEKWNDDKIKELTGMIIDNEWNRLVNKTITQVLKKLEIKRKNKKIIYKKKICLPE